MGSFLRQEPAAPTMNPTPSTASLSRVSAQAGGGGGRYCQCMYHSDPPLPGPPPPHTPPLPLSAGEWGGVSGGEGAEDSRDTWHHTTEGKWGRGWRGEVGPLSSLNKLKVQIKLTCSIWARSVPCVAGGGEGTPAAGGLGNCLKQPQPWVGGRWAGKECVGHPHPRVILGDTGVLVATGDL